MIETVIKRSGRKQDFNKKKIEEAIYKAIKATKIDIEEEKARELSILATNIVVFKLNEKKDTVIQLEEIQNVVEESLMNLGMTDVARNYIRYRFQRELLRQDKEAGISVEKMIKNYITQEDWKVKENANMDYSLQGLNNYIISNITKNFWLNHIFTKEQKKAHETGVLHIHDLNILSTYCCGWDMEDLLLNGFTGVKNKAKTKPAKHLKTALGQLVNFFYTLQGEAAGAQAISSLDTYVAPFIRYDKLTYKEVRQNVQEFIFNLSVPTRVGFQTPFVNVTLDLTVSSLLKDKPVIIGGEYKEETYKEFQKEMDMFNRAFCEVMTEGDASGRIFTFPIPTYNITKDFDWNSKIANEIMKMTSKYGIPYFANFINSDMKPEDARSMCLFPKETLFIKNNNDINKCTIEEVYSFYKNKKIDNEWYSCKNGIKALSLNPNTGKLEWKNIKRFLEVYDDEMINIITKDGKLMKVSKNHLVAVFNKEGITTKKANEISKEDFLLVLKDGSNVLNDSNSLDINPELAWFIGLFIADGNFLYDSRNKDKDKKIRGIQITFNKKEIDLISKTKKFIKEYLNYEMKFIEDSRYENSLRGYVYKSSFGNDLITKYNVQKYNRLPNWIWSSRSEIIKALIYGFFDGDGYKKGKEIHINDLKLSEELNLLMQFIGISTTYIIRKNSQIIRIQHKLGRSSKNIIDNKDTLHNMIPEFLLDKKYVKNKEYKNIYQSYGNKMIGLNSIDKWNLSNEKIEWLRNSDFAVVGIKDIVKEKFDYEQVFYDIELEENNYFVHSNGNITHNCCRLRLDNRVLRKRGGGLFGANPLTGSIGVVTINLPRLGYLYKNKKEFKQNLKNICDLARSILEIKRKVIEKNTLEGLYPYSRYYLRNVYERFKEYWKNHFNTIGIIGMNECIRNYFNDRENITTENGQKFANEILDYLRDIILDYQKDGDLYNLEATPGEGTSYRLATIDKKLFPDIITAGNETSYYTNSTQLPVDYTTDLFEVLRLQDDLQSKYTGGTVLHSYLGQRIHDIEVTKDIIKKVFTNYNLPYLSITPTFSTCNEHGYLDGEQYKCPVCGKDTEIWTRVVGFYRPIQAFNIGKLEEYKDRIEYSVE